MAQSQTVLREVGKLLQPLGGVNLVVSLFILFSKGAKDMVVDPKKRGRILVVFFLVSWMVFGSLNGYWPLPQITALLISFYSKWLGVETVYYKGELIAPVQGYDRVFSISGECAGIFVIAVFILLLLIPKQTTLRFKVMGFLAVLVLMILNSLRIFATLYGADKYGEEFSVNIIHNVLGNVFIFIAVAITMVLVFWLSNLLKKQEKVKT
jgi:exosortase/archaeosortase family protein